MTTLESLADGLWSWPSAIRLGPVSLPRRAVVARLASGGLWVHSPNALDDAMRAELAALGPVEHVVAPNKFHHAHLEAWRAAYPEAVLHGAHGLAKKRADLTFDRELTETPDPAWADLFEQRAISGARKLNEIVFLHRPSRTLILTDMSFHVGREAPFLTRVLMRLNGVYGRLAPSRLLKTFVDDLPEVRRSMLATIDAWEFDAVHVSHGEPIASGGREQLRAVWDAL